MNSVIKDVIAWALGWRRQLVTQNDVHLQIIPKPCAVHQQVLQLRILINLISHAAIHVPIRLHTKAHTHDTIAIAMTAAAAWF